MIALIDYGAGNLTSVRKGFAAGAELYTPHGARSQSRLRRRGAWRRPLQRNRRTREGVAAGHPSITRSRRQAVRHLPRAAVAVPRQRGGSSGARARRHRGLVPPAAANAESAARRLELARHQAVPAAGRDRARHPGLFHPLYAADITPEAVATTTHADRSRRSSRPICCSACSSIPRSPGARASRCSETSWPYALQAPDRLPRRAERLRRQRRARGPAQRRRSGRTRATLQPRRHRRARHPRRHGHLESRQALSDTIRAVSRELFIPLAVGGGIRSLDDAEAAIEAGADKVSVNSATLADPSLVTKLAARYGSQAIVVAVDAKRAEDASPSSSRSGSTAADREAVEWAREAGAAPARSC